MGRGEVVMEVFSFLTGNTKLYTHDALPRPAPSGARRAGSEKRNAPWSLLRWDEVVVTVVGRRRIIIVLRGDVWGEGWRSGGTS